MGMQRKNDMEIKQTVRRRPSLPETTLSELRSYLRTENPG